MDSGLMVVSIHRKYYNTIEDAMYVDKDIDIDRYR